jgi:hypothetical protein
MRTRLFVGGERSEVGLTEDERRAGLFEPGEVPKVGGLAEFVAFHG